MQFHLEDVRRQWKIAWYKEWRKTLRKRAVFIKILICVVMIVTCLMVHKHRLWKNMFEKHHVKVEYIVEQTGLQCNDLQNIGRDDNIGITVNLPCFKSSVSNFNSEGDQTVNETVTKNDRGKKISGYKNCGKSLAVRVIYFLTRSNNFSGIRVFDVCNTLWFTGSDRRKNITTQQWTEVTKVDLATEDQQMMSEVQPTGQKQWKIAWFKNRKCNTRNERSVEILSKHVVRIWKSLMCVIVVAVNDNQDMEMIQDIQYSNDITVTDRNLEMKTNRKQECRMSNKVILRKVLTMLEDEPGRITESDFNIDFCMDMMLTSVRIQKFESFEIEVNTEKLSSLLNKVKPMSKVSALSEEEPGNPESDSETGFRNNLMIGIQMDLTCNIVKDQGCQKDFHIEYERNLHRVMRYYSVDVQEQHRGWKDWQPVVASEDECGRFFNFGLFFFLIFYSFEQDGSEKLFRNTVEAKFSLCLIMSTKSDEMESSLNIVSVSV